MSDDDAKSIFDALVVRHHILDEDKASLAIARKLAHALADPSPSATASIVALREMLPAPPAKGVAVDCWNLSAIDDEIDFGNALSLACRYAPGGGERVVRPDGNVTPMPTVTIGELVTRHEHVTRLLDALRQRMSDARFAFGRRDGVALWSAISDGQGLPVGTLFPPASSGGAAEAVLREAASHHADAPQASPAARSGRPIGDDEREAPMSLRDPMARDGDARALLGERDASRRMKPEAQTPLGPYRAPIIEGGSDFHAVTPIGGLGASQFDNNG